MNTINPYPPQNIFICCPNGVVVVGQKKVTTVVDEYRRSIANAYYNRNN